MRAKIFSTWQQVKLVDIFDFKNGLNKEKVFFGHGSPIVNYMDVNRGGGLYAKDILGKVDVNKSELERFDVKKGDVFFTRTSETLEEIGFTAVALDDFKNTVFSGFVLRARPKNDRLASTYAKYCFTTPKARQEIKEKSSYTTRALTSGSLLNHVNLVLPPLPEQHRIVAVLETWDKAIEKLERKIELKRVVKKGLMQVLLTGKKRLPGFRGGWKIIRLGDIGKCLRGVNYNPKEDLLLGDDKNSYRLLRSNNVQNFKIEKDEIQIVKAKRVKSEQVLNSGDILICMANGSKRLVGKAALFKVSDHFSYTFGAFMGAFRSNGYISNNFVYHLFETEKYRYHITNLLSGSSINNLKPSDIEGMKFNLPSDAKEQEAVVDIFIAISRDIELSEKKLEEIKQQKKYLLNNLITGAIRTPEKLKI